MTRATLIGAQQDDKELAYIRKKALTEEEAADVPSCYFIQNEILMRKWRPPTVNADNVWSIKYQIGVPPLYRSHILH